MAREIWKYKVQDGVHNAGLDPCLYGITMPKGATVLTAGHQGDDIFLWAEVDTEAKRETRVFGVYPAGFGIDEAPESRTYIGTVLMFNSGLVFHVFEVKNV